MSTLLAGAFAGRSRPRLLLAVVAALALTFGLAPAGLLGSSEPAAAATCPCTIWPSTAVPGTAAEPDTAAVEVGVKFRSDTAGSVTGIRFYKGAGNTGTHVGHLWSRTGTLLATATFSGETASGWQQVNLSTPVAISANTTYVVSYYAPVGRYAADTHGLDVGVDNAPLHALGDGVDGGNGVYRYGTGGGFPSNTYQATNYWVDVVVDASTAPDTTPPTVTGRSPAAGATGVPVTTTVSATFSEQIQPSTAAFELRGPGTTVVPSTTSYNSGTSTLTLTPNAALATSTLYTVNLSGATDVAGNTMTATSWTFTTAASASACPCTIWPNTATPATANAQDSSAVELGVKFRASSNGYVTGLRFYKGSSNTGTHIGHLWSRTGTLLATATFSGESASGWQQVTLSAPVAVTANTTYVASYHTDAGFYSDNLDYFTSSGVTRGPLTALANGVDGPNGVYVYGGSGFPTNTYRASNYWVDVVFDTTATDTTPPTLTARAPSPGAVGVATSTRVTATFSEPVQQSTIGFTLTGPAGAVSATTAYDAASQTATLTPSAALADSTTYTATVSGAKDLAGNTMAPVSWSFTTAAPPPPGPEQGPGGPVLVIRSSSAPFSAYTAEILRAEGFNSFASADLSAVTATTLDSYDVVVLGAMPLTAAQVSMLTTWVNAGGNLIAFRPDKQLAGLLGLTSTTGTLANSYLRVDTASAPGAGITGQTIQYHDTADRYTLNGARAVATLYSNATTATTNPAVSLVSVGSNGGQAAAFTYDLPRSIVYQRQGNPAWAGQERDGQNPIRSDDLYFGGSSTDWVDLSKAAIPQADEQQRLLGNLIESMNADRKPLPRFWYFPRGVKAVVVATGDDHGNGGTAGRFDQYLANSPSGCVVADWGCPRFSSYIYTSTPLSNAQAAAYASAGFEIGLHPENGCANFTASSLEATYSTQLSQWQSKYSSLPAPKTNRFHCIVYSDWASQPVTEGRHGIRLDTNYYYWPGSWLQNRPGFMTGSGIPMRFANTDGAFIDVYQAATQMTDESQQTYPFTPNTLLDNALGSLGYYGAFTANMHTDLAQTPEDDGLLSSALARGVPIVSGKQLLDWTDGKNGSAFSGLTWSGGTLSFSVSVGAGANGITGMVPTVGVGGGALTGLTRGGSAVSFTRTVVKGIEYAMFSAAPGAYVATYGSGGAAATVSTLSAAAAPTAAPTGTASVTLRASAPATATVSYGTGPATLDATRTDAVTATTHRVALDGVQPDTTYYYRVTTTTPSGRRTVWPRPDAPPASFRTPARDGAAPVVAGAAVAAAPDGSAAVTWLSSEAADSRVMYGTSADALGVERRDTRAVTAHSLVLTRLTPDTTYYYRVATRDPAGNMTTWPAPSDAPATFVTPAAGVGDHDVVQFQTGRGSLALPAGARRATYVSRTLDAGAMVTWDRATWQASLPSGVRMRVSVRTGSTRVPGKGWSAWHVLSGPGARVVGDSRYLQYRVELTSVARVAARTGSVLRSIGFTHNGALPATYGELGPVMRR